MRVRTLALPAAVTALGAIGIAGAPSALAAAGPPPPPKAAGGQKVTQLAGGLKTPTAFAAGRGVVFEADGGTESSKVPNGGVYMLKHGTATKLPGSPNFAAGLAWHCGALYVSGGTITKTGPKWQLQRWSGFNGHAFAKRTVLYTAPRKFAGFNGIAFGPHGRLYVGVDVGLTDNNDHGPRSTSPYVYDILSFTAAGKDLKVFAQGIRQPWQMVFAPRASSLLVSNLGPDKGSKNPIDQILKVSAGQDYGFPGCIPTTTKTCARAPKAFKTFSPHADIMGLAIIGKRLYMSSFTGLKAGGKAGEVLSMPLSGGSVKPFITGFVAPVVGLGTDGRRLFVGELTGQAFAVRP